MKPIVNYHPGFSLVEVTLAVGVAAVCLVTIFALLPIGLRTNQNAAEQVASADIIGAVIADLRATPPTTPRGNSTTSPQFAITIPANPVAGATTSTLFFDSEGKFTTSADSNSRYRLVITFAPNTNVRAATMVDLKILWPAAASPINALGSSELFLALDRN